MRMGLRELCVSGLLLVAAVTGCGAPHVEGSGQQIQQERQPFDFETLNVNDGIEVTVVVDPDQPRQVRLVGDDNLVALVRTEKSGTTGLFVYLPPEEVASWSSSNPLRLEVTMPKLLAISRTGGGTVDVSGRVAAPEFFTISALGGGTVKVRGLDTESFNLNVDGGGDVMVEGRATQVTSTLSGGSTLQARGLAAQVATISSSGGGSTEMRVSAALNVNVSGGGTVHILGNPVVMRKQLSDGATLTFE
jgi:Putative auto-transporter adhesin, head GIN domain